VWTFYAILVLIILALLRWFPYHLFHKIHKLLAVAYLPIVYHSVVLIRFEYWLHPAGLVMAALMIAGTGAAAIILTGRIGISRKVQGTIRSLTFYPKLYVIEGEVELKGTGPATNRGSSPLLPMSGTRELILTPSLRTGYRKNAALFSSSRNLGIIRISCRES